MPSLSSLLLLGALVAFSSAASYVKRPLDLSPYEQLYKPSLPVYESVSPVYEAPLPPVYTAPVEKPYLPAEPALYVSPKNSYVRSQYAVTY